MICGLGSRAWARVFSPPQAVPTTMNPLSSTSRTQIWKLPLQPAKVGVQGMLPQCRRHLQSWHGQERLSMGSYPTFGRKTTPFLGSGDRL
jgi:hypothetical protein